MALRPRHRDILAAIKSLGGEASTRQVAQKLKLSVNGVSQSLGALYQYAYKVRGRGGDTVWKLRG